MTDVEPYLANLKTRDEIPIVESHQRNASGASIRKHILNLNCRLTTSWAYGTREEQLYMRSKVRNLRPLEEDGLVILKLDRVIETNN